MTTDQIITLALVSLTGSSLITWQALRAIRRDNDRRNAWLIHCFDPPAIERQPGTDLNLLIDAELAYGDTKSLNQLRNAIHQHRKEKLP